MREFAVDACCLINILAADRILPMPTGATFVPGTATHGMEVKLYIPSQVADESLYVLQAKKDDETKLVKVPITLDPYFDAALLHQCNVESGDETALFVDLATRLDDGEAACLAIAKSRGWILHTDDRKATTIATGLDVTVTTTGELVQYWSEKVGATEKEIVGVLRNIQRLARFVPRPGSPEHRWWMSYVGD